MMSAIREKINDPTKHPAMKLEPRNPIAKLLVQNRSICSTQLFIVSTLVVFI